MRLPFTPLILPSCCGVLVDPDCPFSGLVNFALQYRGASLRPVNDLPDNRSSVAQAVAWSSRVTTISLGMGLPGLFGYWVDKQLGTEPVFLILGAVFGLISGLWQLIRLSKRGTAGKDTVEADREDDPSRGG